MRRKVERMGRRKAAAECNQVSVGDMQENVRASLTAYFDDLAAQVRQPAVEPSSRRPLSFGSWQSGGRSSCETWTRPRSSAGSRTRMRPPLWAPG